jgi:competence protein ComEA
MPPPPPFVRPPGSWSQRASALLTGVGRQGRGAAAVALVALVAAGAVWFRAQPRPVPADPPGGLAGLPAVGTTEVGAAADPSAGADGAAAGGAGGGGGTVAVHVAGRVRRPGLVTLPAGSRVADAIGAAGGAAAGADLDRINLASRLRDGEQVLVLARGQPAPAGSAAGAGGGGPSAPLDLNTASAEQLEALPGVGQVMAERIVAYREHQPFRSVADLRQVEGIGERRLAALKGLVTVG